MRDNSKLNNRRLGALFWALFWGLIFFALLSGLCQNQAGVLTGFYSEATPLQSLLSLMSMHLVRCLLS
jgi:hypothetical protein